MRSRWLEKLQWKNSRESRSKTKKLTINDDGCQEAFLLAGVPVVGLALLVPEARHTFRAGQVLAHGVFHAGSPAVLPARPRAAVGNTNQGQQEQHSFSHTPSPALPCPRQLLRDPLPQLFLLGGQILLSVALPESYWSSTLDLKLAHRNRCSGVLQTHVLL